MAPHHRTSTSQHLLARKNRPGTIVQYRTSASTAHECAHECAHKRLDEKEGGKSFLEVNEVVLEVNYVPIAEDKGR